MFRNPAGLQSTTAGSGRQSRILCRTRLCAALTLAETSRLEALVEQLSAACGGVNYLTSETCCCGCSARKGRLYGKVTVVTGGAQGFGFGIAESLAAEDAAVAIADMNYDGANKAAEELCAKFGANKAFALEVNISSEESVAKMYRDLVLKTGGLDLLVANAGVLRAGSVKTPEQKRLGFRHQYQLQRLFPLRQIRGASHGGAKQTRTGLDGYRPGQLKKRLGRQQPERCLCRQ